ncbi:hypothetical protein LCGC14_2622360, partial [marine sediment metagenome]
FNKDFWFLRSLMILCKSFSFRVCRDHVYVRSFYRRASGLYLRYSGGDLYRRSAGVGALIASVSKTIKAGIWEEDEWKQV